MTKSKEEKKELSVESLIRLVRTGTRPIEEELTRLVKCEKEGEKLPFQAGRELRALIAHYSVLTRNLDFKVTIPELARALQKLSLTKAEKDDDTWTTQIRRASHFLLARYSEPAKNTDIEVKLPHPTDSVSVMFSVTPADISVDDFVERMIRYTKCSPSALIYALIYLRRVEESDCRLNINALTLHRLLITSIMVAVKFVDDAWYSNKYYARVGGVASLQEMNRLELEMLRLLKFRLYVSLDEFEEMVDFGLKLANGGTIVSTRLRIARL